MGKVVPVGVLALLLGAVSLGAPLEEPSAATLADTVRWDPHGKAAALAIDLLVRRGEEGWKALGALARDLERTDPEAAVRIASALAGDEAGRIAVARAAYAKVKSERVRAALALVMARGYPEGADLLHRRLRDNAPGAADLLRDLAGRGLPDEEVLAALTCEPLAPVAHEILRARGIAPDPELLAPLARKAAPRGLSPGGCREFAAGFAKAPDFSLAVALAKLLESEDEDLRVGAHCLLLAASGLDLPADRTIWESWAVARRGRFEPPDALSGGQVKAAVVRAVRYLRKDLLADGRCSYPKKAWTETAVGATALAVLALRAADVPREDPAIEKARDKTLLVFGRDGSPGVPNFSRTYETYSLALLAMALGALDPERYREPLVAIRDRLCSGILANGQWTYRCLSETEGGRPKSGDNSNTQYAALGLRALDRAGVEVPPLIWERAAENWRKTVQSSGWGYRTDGKHQRFSMTAAGIGSFAICLEGIHKAKAGERILAEPAICEALEYLGKLLLLSGYGKQAPYAMYGVERACRLTGAGRFESANRTFVWYRRGARMLLDGQEEDGSWGGKRTKDAGISPAHGVPVDTSFAILFLTRATATVPGAKPIDVVKVRLTEEEDVPEPAPEPPPEPPPPPPPPAGPALELDAAHVRTSDGEIVIRGRVATGASLTVDGQAVEVAADGRFAAALTIEGSRDIEVVARAADGKETRRRVDAALDMEPPVFALAGSEIRHVGKQRIEFRAKEPLSSLWIAGHYSPADGRDAEATVDLRDGQKTLLVTAVDLAGNRTRQTIDLDVVNRVLVLDGKSAVRVDLRDRPRVFTLECWVKGPKPDGRPRSIASNVEGAGFGIFWCTKAVPVPKTYVMVKGGWLQPKARHPWKWGSWTHLALTYDGARASFWVDGKLHEEAEGRPLKSSSRAFYIGAEPDRHNRAGSFFAGSVDEVRLSSVVRYTETFRPEEYYMADADTILLLHFDTDTPQAFLDASHRHHNGKPMGTPQVVEEKR